MGTGFMCRFTIWSALAEKLSDAQLGLVFAAALEYAKTGKEPPEENRNVMWAIIRADIDDQTAYMPKVTMNRKYAAYLARAKRKSGRTLTLDEWEVAGRPDD